MGTIIPLNSGMYQYEIPLKEPSDEKQIINYQYKKADQYWREPVRVDVKRLSAKERIEFIERERQRWEEGVYVLINGKLVYLTGMHYDHLTYMSFKAGRAEFFAHQVRDFYFRDYTRRDPKCRGRVWMKPRRYGMTMEEVTEATYSLQENFSNNVGLQSDTKEKVQSTLLTPIINSYANRPKYMRSDYYKPNGKLLVTQLALKNNLAPGDDGEESGDFLLGWLKGFPSLPRAMDGEEMIYIVMDEVWKWQTSSPKETAESNMKVLMGRNRAGMISMLSTMGDSDDYVNAVMDGCDIIAKSNPMVRDENGYTIFGLYEYFVPAIYSFDIPPDVFEMDRYGEVNADKHTEYIHNKLKKLDKNSKSYVFEKRRLPMSKEDALLSAQLVTYFRRVVINVRLNELRGMLPGRKPYIRGMLEEGANGKVWFVSDAERQRIAGDVQVDPGIWLVNYLPYFSMERGIDTRNRFTETGKVYFPPVNPEGAIGYDPIDYPKELTTSKHLSRASLFVRKKFDYHNLPDSPDYFTGIVALCVNRPDDPHDANKEAMKACRLWAYPCMHERSVSHVYEDFEESGMLPFLMKDAKNGVYGMSPSDIKAKKDGLVMLQTRYRQPQEEGEKDELLEYPFEEGLMDLDNFDIGNTTPFDVAMSELYCEHGLKQIQFTNQTNQSANSMKSIIDEIIVKRQQPII